MIMAVELRRTGELFLCSSREFQLSGNENDVVDNLDLEDFSGKCFDETQEPWDFDAGFSDSNELTGSDNQSETEVASSEAETEKSKDDCIAELTRQMAAQFTAGNRDKTNESWDFGGLSCTTNLWSPFGSSYGSPEEGPSQETTPPTTPAIEKRQHYSGWDSQSVNATTTNNTFDDPDNITANMEKMNIDGPNYTPISTARFRRNQSPTLDHQIRAIQLYKLKQELLLKQRRSLLANKVINQNEHQISQGSESNHVQFGKKVKSHPCGGPDQGARQRRQYWANHSQHSAGSGMRAVFLGGPSSKAGQSCGTGVFLPSVIGDPSHLRKKKGCSPVLIPAKVMQALKIHFDRMDSLSRQNTGTNFPLQHDNACNYAPKTNGILDSEKKRQHRAVPATNQNDIGLPQDWTY